MILESIQIRKPTASDIPFIMSTWLNTFRYNSPFGKRIKNDIFFPNQKEICQRILVRPTTKAYIACPKEDSNIIVSYLVYEEDEKNQKTIHFVYTKDSFRKMGIAVALIKHAEIDLSKAVFTHWCDDTFWIKQKYLELIHNPYLAL
jgi:predicted GNAT family acetyltransferase